MSLELSIKLELARPMRDRLNTGKCFGIKEMGMTDELLDRVRAFPNATLLEVGVAQAASAVKFLELENIALYIGVDPWEWYEDSPDPEFNKGYLDRKMGLWVNQEKWDSVYKIAQDAVAPYGARARLIRAFSHDAIQQVDDTLDIVSIDGNHQYEYALYDIRVWYEKMRSGGMMLVDDVRFRGGPMIDNRWGGQEASEVERAVDDFTREIGVDYELVDNNAIIIKP